MIMITKHMTDFLTYTANHTDNKDHGNGHPSISVQRFAIHQ